MDNYYYYDTNDLANMLINLAGERNKANFDNIEYCIYYLKAAAENEFNHDGFRALYNILQRIAENNSQLIY